MISAGAQALAYERLVLRTRRATAFLRRNFPGRIGRLDDTPLAAYTTERLSEFASTGIVSEQDQLSALALTIHRGAGRRHDHMPDGLMLHAGKWAAPQTPRQQLSQSLGALDISHEAQADLTDRNRAASVLYELYTGPRIIARRGRDPRIWCEKFAPGLWALLPDRARYGHCRTSAAIAARYLSSFHDAILFACLGLAPGVGFSEDPLYSQFRTALIHHRDHDPDGVRVALGNALISHWRQIVGKEQK